MKKKKDEDTKLIKPSEEEKKKGERVKSCGWWVPWCMFNYRNAIENRVMEIEKT